MKGFPKHFATVYDYKYILENYPEWRDRVIKELEKIYNLKDDKAVKAVKPKEPKILYSTLLSKVETDFNKGVIPEAIKKGIENKLGYLPNLVVIQEEDGWSLRIIGKVWNEELQKYQDSFITGFPGIRIKKVDENAIFFLEKEREEWETEEIDNPMPLYKQKGFKTKEEILNLINKYKEINKNGKPKSK